MIITLAGHAGTGKTTVGKILEQKLGYEFLYTGGMVRKMAEDKHMTVAEFQDSLDNLTELDEYIDGYQKKLGETRDNIIIDGHIAFHFIPHSFKVKLLVDPHEGARRIFAQSQKEDRGNEKKYADLDEAFAETQARIERHKQRFKQKYNIDMDDAHNYDLVIDTTSISAEAVAQKIVDNLHQ